MISKFYLAVSIIQCKSV